MKELNAIIQKALAGIPIDEAESAEVKQALNQIRYHLPNEWGEADNEYGAYAYGFDSAKEHELRNGEYAPEMELIKGWAQRDNIMDLFEHEKDHIEIDALQLVRLVAQEKGKDSREFDLEMGIIFQYFYDED